jgi:hypothetical protein
LTLDKVIGTKCRVTTPDAGKEARNCPNYQKGSRVTTIKKNASGYKSSEQERVINIMELVNAPQFINLKQSQALGLQSAKIGKL